jgi:hypothetical protein
MFMMGLNSWELSAISICSDILLSFHRPGC